MLDNTLSASTDGVSQTIHLVTYNCVLRFGTRIRAATFEKDFRINRILTEDNNRQPSNSPTVGPSGGRFQKSSINPQLTLG